MTTLRRATPADARELARLRSLMHAAMGQPDGPEDLLRAEQAFARRLGTPDFAAYAVEDAGRLVSAGAGWLQEHLPSPTSPDGRRGHIASMSTEPAAQRRGHARAVFGALLGWFTEQGVARVELRATPVARSLYEAFGFREQPGTAMAWYAAPARPDR